MLNRLQDVFKFFQQHKVRYMVIGGVASVIYGVPRATCGKNWTFNLTAPKKA